MITVPLSSLAPDKGNTVRNDTNRPADRHPALPQLLPTKAPPGNTTASPLLKLPSNGDSRQGQTTKAPTNLPEKSHNPAGNFHLSTSRFLFLFLLWLQSSSFDSAVKHLLGQKTVQNKSLDS